MFDLKHPFFRPLWIRIVTVAITLGWAAVEFASGNPGWAVFFAAVGAWCIYQFFVAWSDPGDDQG